MRVMSPNCNTVTSLVEELIAAGVIPERAWAIITDAVAVGVMAAVYRQKSMRHRQLEQLEEERANEPYIKVVITTIRGTDAVSQHDQRSSG